MAVLHEIIAVETSKKALATKIVKETVDNFSKRENLFQGLHKTYRPTRDDDPEKLPEERVDITTTVMDRLNYTFSVLAPFIDVTYQKEVANLTAHADVMIDEKPFLSNMSALSLLTLEQRLPEIREMIAACPCLESGKQWVPDNVEPNVWAMPAVTTLRVKKIPKVLVKYEATKEHPAQTEVLSEDVTIGTFTSIISSGKITSKQKMELLSRVDLLIEEVKKARSRANNEKVQNIKIADKLIQFIMTGIH